MICGRPLAGWLEVGTWAEPIGLRRRPSCGAKLEKKARRGEAAHEWRANFFLAHFCALFSYSARSLSFAPPPLRCSLISRTGLERTSERPSGRVRESHRGGAGWAAPQLAGGRAFVRQPVNENFSPLDAGLWAPILWLAQRLPRARRRAKPQPLECGPGRIPSSSSSSMI